MDSSLRRSMFVFLCDQSTLNDWLVIVWRSCVTVVSFPFTRNLKYATVTFLDLMYWGSPRASRQYPNLILFVVLVHISTHVSKLQKCTWENYSIIFCFNVGHYIAPSCSRTWGSCRRTLSACFEGGFTWFISLCFRNGSPESFFHRNDWWPFVWRCSFHWNRCFLNDDLCRSHGLGNLVRYAQGRRWLCVF